jgi:hypothetical protein
MPFETKWLVDDKLLYQRFHGTITIMEYIHSVKHLERLIAEHGIRLFHLLIDVSEVEQYPSGASFSRYWRKDIYENVGWTMMIVAKTSVAHLAAILLTQVSARNFYTVLTLQEALDFLAVNDVDLLEQNP